jgi:hypothetical protein
MAVANPNKNKPTTTARQLMNHPALDMMSTA